MLHITFSKYDCIIVHKAYYLFTCTCVSINSFHSHSHSHKDIWKALIFFKDLNKNCDMMYLFLKTFKDFSWTSYF